MHTGCQMWHLLTYKTWEASLLSWPPLGWTVHEPVLNFQQAPSSSRSRFGHSEQPLPLKINGAPHCLPNLGKPSLENPQIHLPACIRNCPISKAVQVLLSSSRDLCKPQPFHGDTSAVIHSNSIPKA